MLPLLCEIAFKHILYGWSHSVFNDDTPQEFIKRASDTISYTNLESALERMLRDSLCFTRVGILEYVYVLQVYGNIHMQPPNYLGKQSISLMIYMM